MFLIAPILHCNSEGNWLLPSMNCFCSKGFEPNHELTECIGTLVKR